MLNLYNVYRFFKGWECGRLITNRKYCDKWEWPLLSYNFKLDQPIIGVIVARRWHWFGIINRGWNSDGYGYYDQFGDWIGSEEYQLGIKQWGWEYQVFIGNEVRWLWPFEFIVI